MKIMNVRKVCLFVNEAKVQEKLKYLLLMMNVRNTEEKSRATTSFIKLLNRA